MRVLVAGMVCLALSACGGGNTSNTAGDTQSTSNAPSSAATETSGAWSQAQCTQLAAAMAAAAGGVGPSTDGADLGSLADYLRKISAGAPADLQGDFITMADGLQTFYDTLKAAGIDLTDPNTYSSPAAVATLSQAADKLQKDVGDAATRIQSRFQELCG